MRNVMKTLVALLAVAVAGTASAGDIKGTIKFTGAAPKAEKVKTTKDQATCGAEVDDESLVVAAGKLKNVVITVKGAAGAATPADIKIDQAKCHYLPHVQAATVGAKVEIINSDPVLHNVHGYLGTATAFNMAMPIKNQKIPKKLEKQGLVKLKCDVHSWMSAYVVVHENGFFAVSGDDGSFTIKGVPAGTYEVTAWHEKLGEKKAQVTVPATGDVAQEFSFGG